MQRDDLTIRIPNAHRGDIVKQLLAQLLKQAGIAREEWEKMEETDAKSGSRVLK